MFSLDKSILYLLTNHGRWGLVGAVLGLCLLAVACAPDGDTGTSASGYLPHMAHFTDVTEEAGIEFQNGAFRWGTSADPVAMMGGGLCWLDYNQDGWLDLYAVNTYAVAEAGKWEAEGGLPRSALFRNDKGHFTDVSSDSGSDLQLRGNGCVAADFNLDGWPDLYITSSRVNALLWNNGDGTFTEGATEAGVDAYGWQTSAAVGDLNGDSWPDLFVAGYVDLNNRIPSATQGFPNTNLGVRDLLYLNEGPGSSGKNTFREVGVEVGLESENYEYGLGSLMTDLDMDGDLDILVANDTKPNRLYENVGWPGGLEADPERIGFRLAEVGQYAEIDDTNSGMGVASGDYNGDGRLDLVITNLGQQLHSVYLNQSTTDTLVFDDATGKMGVADIGVGSTGWGIAWADVDLDTDLDLIIADGTVPVMDPPDDVQQLQFMANLTAQGMTGLFQDLTEFAGFNEIEPLLARGSALADYDNDGDLDIAISTVAGPLVLLRNDYPDGRWLTVELEGFQPGALVKAVLPDGREMLCETHAGSSYLSSEDPRCHFGLGAAGEVAELSVRWPNGSQTRMEGVSSNQIVALSPGELPVSEAASQAIDPEAFLWQVLLERGGAKPMDILPPASPEMIELGRALFWDRELSGTRDVSCATCHHSLAGTGDDLSVSIGVGGTGFAGQRRLGDRRFLVPRNAPEIYNRGADGWHTMFWDGRIYGTAEDGFLSPAGAGLPGGLDNVVAVQAMFPVTSRDEMRGYGRDVDVFGQPNELGKFADTDLQSIWDALMDRLMVFPEYQRLFAAAYPDVSLGWLRFQDAANAIAAYEMSVFTSADSPWDRYLAGQSDALSPEALSGAKLFYGQAGCSRCHNGTLLTDQEFYNIGVPQLGPGKGDEAPRDYGRGRETGLADDQYSFRTPPLRNVAATGPWMHNGAYTSLEAAVRHHLDPVTAFENYDVRQLNPMMWDTYEKRTAVLQTLDPLVETPLELTDQQVNDLLAFLEALTSPIVEQGCELVPASVPSGLPVDTDPSGSC